MDYFTQEDHDWFQDVQELQEKYKINIDNDEVWVEEIESGECVYTFTSYGYHFIHALLNDMGINAEYC